MNNSGTNENKREKKLPSASSSSSFFVLRFDVMRVLRGHHFCCFRWSFSGNDIRAKLRMEFDVVTTDNCYRSFQFSSRRNGTYKILSFFAFNFICSLQLAQLTCTPPSSHARNEKDFFSFIFSHLFDYDDDNDDGVKQQIKFCVIKTNGCDVKRIMRHEMRYSTGISHLISLDYYQFYSCIRTFIFSSSADHLVVQIWGICLRDKCHIQSIFFILRSVPDFARQSFVHETKKKNFIQLNLNPFVDK